MNDSHANPVPLKDRRDQLDLVERIAGQAARDLPEPAPLSASTLARIAMHIEEQRSRPHALRMGRVLVATSVLLGIVTVASAARMDLMPRWFVKVVGMESKPAPGETPPRRAKPRNVGKNAEAPVAPVNEPMPSQEAARPEAAPMPVKAPEAAATGEIPVIPARVASPEGATAVRRVAMASATTEERGMERGRVVDGYGHAYGHGQNHDQDRGYGNGQGVGQGRKGRFAGLGKAEPLRVAAQSAGNARALPEAASANALSAPAPSPGPEEMPVPVVSASEPATRPAPSVPPAPAAPAPVPSLPKPAPTAVAAPATNNPASRHLKEVVRALRIDHAPGTALDLLDRHAHELAGNAFVEEALLLRVEAMLALKRQPEALRILDSTSLANTPAASVLLLTRGQLRARANRCAEAVADFDLALARAHRPSKQALLGRAQCKQKLGDLQGAQADLDRLHREFPGETAP